MLLLFTVLIPIFPAAVAQEEGAPATEVVTTAEDTASEAGDAAEGAETPTGEVPPPAVVDEAAEDGADTAAEDKTEEATYVTKAALDTVWVLIAGVLVMFMQAGFAVLEAGFVRAKNSLNVVMKNIMDFCFATITYWAVGFAIMFGAGNALFGTSGFFLSDPTGTTFDSLSWTIVPLEAKYFFQLVFCATSATIVAGAVAERTKFVAYIIYSIVISAVIYPVIGHWIWGGGWLGSLGMLDFAGSTVVHSTGGWLSLAGVIILGPRVGKYKSDGTPKAITGHNIPLAALGAFILWFGWFGFNAGSTMAADAEDIAHIVTTTNLSAGAGGIAAMFTSWWMFKKPDISMAINGALAGLVGITAPCAFVTAGGAIWIGLFAGVLVVLAILFLDKVLKIDDPVGAIAVHGVNGAWGTLAVGIFAKEGGLLYGGGFKLLGIQALGVVSVFAFAMTTGLLLFYVIKHLVGFRVSREEELRGLDIEEHGMESYPSFQIFTTE
ncbi:MAG: ammonium transporter [Deltaproteobacteria bacterium]|uniref:Ammonium transporter n=1 Tax=Candidatus Zymogenus saltonus TaxID=2844893 RepID=A0A9D8KG50_9DELT|nr:ammonium transporter [Candidatus Zymogenus saltonus]